MIYTMTVNPAIDYVIRVDDFRPGEVNRTVGEEVFFGGKGINVSCMLKNLGVESTAFGFLAGFTGDAIDKGMSEKGIRTDFVRLDSGITRINVKLKAGEETDINGQGPQIPSDKIEALFAKTDRLGNGDILVLAGSVPNTLPENMYQRLMERLDGKGIRFVVDATGDLLKKSLQFKPFLIKPNSFELGEIVGRSLQTDSEIADAAKQMQRLGAANVLVSMAANGALLLTENGELMRIGIVKGKTVNSVGAGDSMVAGFLAGYLKTGDYAYALKLGTAAGGATALSNGLGERALIDELIEKL